MEILCGSIYSKTQKQAVFILLVTTLKQIQSNLYTPVKKRLIISIINKSWKQIQNTDKKEEYRNTHAVVNK